MDDQGGGDRLYEMMEGEEGDLGKQLRESQHKPMEVGDRHPRTIGEMVKEADWLRSELERDGVLSTPPKNADAGHGNEMDKETT